MFCSLTQFETNVVVENSFSLQCKEFSANSKGILADDVTFLCGLRACANTNAFYDELVIHAQIIEEDFDEHTLVCHIFYIGMQDVAIH